MNLLIIIPLITLLIISFLYIIRLKHKINKQDTELHLKTREWLDYKNRISLVSYQVRNYREGKNGFTVLRYIEDILRKFEEN